MLDIIKIGNKLDLRSVKREQIGSIIEKSYKMYKSRILDIIDDDTLRIAMPIEGGAVRVLPVDAVFEVFFYTNNGLYESKVKVIKRYKENNVYILEIEIVAPIVKNQRREFYRYNCIIDLKYSIISEEESEMPTIEHIEAAREKSLEWKDGFIVDISGGGIRFTSGEQIDSGNFLMVRFSLIVNHQMKQFEAMAKLISSEKILNRSGQYESRAKFVNLPKEETEEIVKYIFEEERKSRKNRKS